MLENIETRQKEQIQWLHGVTFNISGRFLVKTFYDMKRAGRRRDHFTAVAFTGTESSGYLIVLVGIFL